MAKKTKSWCSEDEHESFDRFTDFNAWIDSDEEEAKALKTRFGLNKLTHPSKAFFASDREAYEQAFREYRLQKRKEVLSTEFLDDAFGDSHWSERNETRFDQFLDQLFDNAAVPFIGAGVSVAGGFPTWKNHLRQQGKTAGIPLETIESLLSDGQFETIIDKIESTLGKDVFAQEIRDVFSKTGDLEEITLIITDLFTDTLITTNYDRLIETSFDIGPEDEFEVFHSFDAMVKPASNRTTIIKLHGDIRSPQRCILGRSQYDDAYGSESIDLSLPIPKLLKYHYITNSLLFVGCSLNNDRTIQVFRAVKEAIGDLDLPQHFSLEQIPVDDNSEPSEQGLISRNAELLNLGITPIWFPHGEFSFIESILRHSRCELNYRICSTLKSKSPKLSASA
ncbi:SIR2 family protein [Pelagicoccus sp. SDUM812002]|uniref:SIR2 family NAD-dependent protein deacylase n=1 Tax=Pelagicoccus sp. SDUM812002 TaxID=3041266 RepID=UPI00280D2704|nr:SIR2 family protein [Pelagicoccus sp. SDUM812002]MDQ8184306.1 SIR2 family protein [Pelagicoccus sp. SDUM812002]